MARVDSLLRLATEQGADELHLGTGATPRMFAAGAPKKLSIPETSEVTLRHLLGELLGEDAERTLRGGRRVDARYEAIGATFTVELTPRAGAAAGPALSFDVVFKRVPSGSLAPAPSSSAALTAVPPGESPAPPVTQPTPPPQRTPAPLPAPPMAPTLVVPASTDGPPAPVTRVAEGPLAELLARAIRLGASDVHLAAGERVHVRVGGGLRPLEGPEVDVERVGETLVGAERAALDEGRSVDFALEARGLGRFRGNAYRSRGRLAVALRLLRPTPPELGELGLPVSLDDLPLRAHGLVIVCGPTGSGKSTTLAALARRALERRTALVLTLEDPIEYALDACPRPVQGLARQRQIGADVRDFPTGLRDALREDPDVLLVGEMRDPESIGLALTAAETGHLVLTSLHARSAGSAVERICDAYAPERQKQVRVQLADALVAIVAQRLLPTRSGRRAVAMEVLRATASVQNLIREGRTAQLSTAMQAGREDGMLPFERSLGHLVRSGEVSMEDALAAANDRDALLGYAR